MANFYRVQQKLVWGSAYSLSSHQVHCTVMIMSQMAMGLVCATFISLGVLGTLLVRMHERGFLRMVAAEPVAEEL